MFSLHIVSDVCYNTFLLKEFFRKWTGYLKGAADFGFFVFLNLSKATFGNFLGMRGIK